MRLSHSGTSMRTNTCWIRHSTYNFFCILSCLCLFSSLDFDFLINGCQVFILFISKKSNCLFKNIGLLSLEVCRSQNCDILLSQEAVRWTLVAIFYTITHANTPLHNEPNQKGSSSFQKALKNLLRYWTASIGAKKQLSILRGNASLVLYISFISNNSLTLFYTLVVLEAWACVFF